MLDFPEGIDEYATAHTTVPDSVFDDIAVDVQSTGAAGMMSGRTVGYFLNTLVTITNAKRVLEVGTFVGYSALMMASALPDDGELITCDVSEEFTSIARKHWARHPAGRKDRSSVGASDRNFRGLCHHHSTLSSSTPIKRTISSTTRRLSNCCHLEA